MLREQPTANGSASGVGARTPWGWAGPAQDFLNAPYDDWAASLETHHLALNGEGPSTSQRDAWRDEFDVLVEAFLQVHDPTWNLVCEFELPFEGGRRPDVVVLAGGTIIILEFKTTPLVAASHIDQVAAYARDIREYHEASHWRKVAGVLVSTGLEAENQASGDVTVCGRAKLAQVLNE